ncbi:L,D-transpeptidase family protein [Mesorhizobium sp. M0621]|uniref:L,D-transpeptidase family protein n=1 Tax=Mesorhizobium sp. M0621 TaxID=2956974 RepID=UPI00333B793A
MWGEAATATWPPSSFRRDNRRSVADVADNSLCHSRIHDHDVAELLQLVDWTDGCIAVTDSDMDEIWAMVADGTPIEIER